MFKLTTAISFLLLPTTAFTTVSRFGRSQRTILWDAKEDADNHAQSLRDKAAKLRAEIAAMEGKTVAEVEKEALEKKEREQTAAAERKKARIHEKPMDRGRMVEVPGTRDDMIYQAARSVERAYRDGVKRQTVRFALTQEDQPLSEPSQWPGGARQMYREAAKPLTSELLKILKVSSDQLLAPDIREQDVWDFDGSAIHTAEAKEGARFDVQALVMPNTDVKYTMDIDAIDQAMGDRLFLLINPFWRNIDSWGINLLAPGAKTKAQKIIFEKGYDETYVFLRFSCRGEECVAIKSYPYDWQVFAYLEDTNGWENTVRLGSSPQEPKSEIVTKWLNERPEFKLSKTMRNMSR